MKKNLLLMKMKIIYTVHEKFSFIEVNENPCKCIEREHIPLEEGLLKIIRLGLRVTKLGEPCDDQEDQIEIRTKRLIEFFELEDNEVFYLENDYLFIRNQVVYRLQSHGGTPIEYACAYNFLVDCFTENVKIISTHRHV